MSPTPEVIAPPESLAGPPPLMRSLTALSGLEKSKLDRFWKAEKSTPKALSSVRAACRIVASMSTCLGRTSSSSSSASISATFSS